MTFKPSSHFETPCRASYQWLQREEDLLFEVSMGTRGDSSVLDLATKMKRNPLDVAMHVLDSDIPGMIGDQPFTWHLRQAFGFAALRMHQPFGTLPASHKHQLK